MTPQTETAPSDERPLSRVYATLFLAAICLPFLRTAISGTGDGAARERRRSERFPNLTASAASWSSFPRRFEGWYANHFGFREQLVRQHNHAKWFGLATSPSENVVRGRDDWVFYAENATLDQVRGAYPFEEAEIEAWIAMLEERRAWLEERGSRYLFVVAPVKASIYPDYQPPGYEPVGPSRLDQLTEALAARSEVRFLDLRPALIDERSNDRGGDRTYYPLGTHWTRRGALRGWREIVEAVPELFTIAPPPLEELERVLHGDDQGDSWGTRLYLEEQLRQEVWVYPLGASPPRMELEYGRQGARYEVEDAGARERPRVMLFHDSFGSLLRPLLARSCRSLTCFWRYAWEPALIEQERPDLVVDLFVERTLVTLDPPGMPLQTQTGLESGFTRATELMWSLSADELSALVWEATGSTPELRILTLPDLHGEEAETCWIALEVESDTGGVLEIALQGREPRRAAPTPLRPWATRAFAGPGRHTLYFARAAPARPSSLLLRSRQEPWTLHSVAARRSGSAP